MKDDVVSCKGVYPESLIEIGHHLVKKVTEGTKRTLRVPDWGLEGWGHL